MTAKKRGVTDGGKEENPLKRAFPPSPAPPSSFRKLLIKGAAAVSLRRPGRGEDRHGA